MSTWQEFYQAIRDPAWPDCDQEHQYSQLPLHIQQECQQVHGYQPGSFRKTSSLLNRVFPIKTATACQLKWTWSTLYLTTGNTASCHRSNHHAYNAAEFDFHNTPEKIQDRQAMLEGRWPGTHCQYCEDIESAGGQSDRITNLDFVGIHTPPELDQDPGAVQVTPRMLEVYFDNVCNLKCVYCGPHFSSLWDAELTRHENRPFVKDPRLEVNKNRIFSWLRDNSQHLTVFNFLGGEPLFQAELDQCLAVFEQHPAPNLKFQIFTNLNASLDRVQSVVERVRRLVDRDCLREFEITASLDCWGPPQEYARFPLDLAVWQRNFEYLLNQRWINLIVNSTVTPLTIKTLPDLLQRINQWNQIRPVYHYQNSVTHRNHFRTEIFGNIFESDFARALELKPQHTPEQRQSRQYLHGIAQQSIQGQPQPGEIKKLFDFLNTLDSRRNTDWTVTFPWLVAEFARYNLQT
jgi:hypothetical protein